MIHKTLEEALKYNKAIIIKQIERVKSDFLYRKITYMQMKAFRKEIDAKLQAFRYISYESGWNWDLL